jgi:serine/threonine protein kinase
LSLFKIIKFILDSIDVLHSNNIIHSDYKLENIVLNVDEECNITDLKIGKGFNALPGGYRYGVRFSDFIGHTRVACFWTVSKDEYVYDAEQIANGVPTRANDFTLTFLSEFAIGMVDVRCGKSVRLLKL